MGGSPLSRTQPNRAHALAATSFRHPPSSTTSCSQDTSRSSRPTPRNVYFSEEFVCTATGWHISAELLSSNFDGLKSVAGSSDSEHPGAPHACRFAAANQLPLDKRLGDLKAEFAALQQETAKLKEKHSELARGSDPKQADTFMRDEVLPIFDERNRLLGEALLVVNAKALASNTAPEMPPEMRVR